MKLRATLATASLVFASALVTTTYAPDVAAHGIKGEWRVPPKKAGRPNPIPANEASKHRGRMTFVNDCQGCHGDPDPGLGPGSGYIDLTSEVLWAQTDGAIFWKIKTGRGRMPGFKRVSNKEIWDVINYMRDEFSD